MTTGSICQGCHFLLADNYYKGVLFSPHDGLGEDIALVCCKKRFYACYPATLASSTELTQQSTRHKQSTCQHEILDLCCVTGSRTLLSSGIARSTSTYVFVHTVHWMSENFLVHTCVISSGVVTSLEIFFRWSTTASTALATPMQRSKRCMDVLLPYTWMHAHSLSHTHTCPQHCCNAIIK